MGFDAFVWVDLEFPSDPKDCMTRWKQSLLDSGKWSDWGGFGAVAGPVKGYETVAAVLAQAARYAAMQRIEGKAFIFSVALGPTQVKVRAAFDKSQVEWWRSLACMARAAAPFDAAGEFGWATVAGDGGRESYVAQIADCGSQFLALGPDELRRLDRHPAVVELEAKRAEVAAAAPPVPLTLKAPTPRPPGSGRGYRRRPYGQRPRPAPVAAPVDAEVPPEDEVIAGALDDDAPVDLDAGADAEPEVDADAGDHAPDHADDDGAADDFDEAPARAAAPEPARGRGRPPKAAVKAPAAKPVKAAAPKPVKVAAPKPVKVAEPKPAKVAEPKPAKVAEPKPAKKAPEKAPKAAKPAPAKKKPARAK
jgi:hypothetical protein